MLRKDAQSNSAHQGAQQREQPSFCEDSDSDEEECPLPGDSSKCVLHFLEREEWLNGTEEEKRAILRRKVLELVKSKKDARLLWCKYVDRKKQRNGKTDIYKIRLVALWPGEG